jgi:hypothetical protein
MNFLDILVLASLIWLVVCEIVHWLPRAERDSDDELL